MNQISNKLGKLIENYYKQSKSNNLECRILVPGLDEIIAQDLHAYLISEEIPSYLVVDKNEKPSRKKAWLHADGLASKRLGSFVIVAYPGEIAYIQDSIKGTGGTIRSMTFSDEWPWIDDQNEYFKFDGPFLDELLSSWTDNTVDKEWLRDVIINGLLPATIGISERAKILLKDLLGDFSPSLYPDLKEIKEKFARHCGIPFPGTKFGNDSSLFIKEAMEICDKIIEMSTEIGIREEIKERVEDIISDEDEKSELKEYLDIFFDGLGKSGIRLSGILGLQNCWGERSSVKIWEALNIETLRRLFIIPKIEEIVLDCEVYYQRGCYSKEKRVLATFQSESFSIEAKYKIPEKLFTSNDFYVRLVHKSNVLEQGKCISIEGAERFDMDSSNIFNRYERTIILRAQIVCANRVFKEWRIRVHLCGERRPNFILVSPSFHVFDAIKEVPEDDSEIEKLEINEPVYIYLFQEANSPMPVIFQDEAGLNLLQSREGIFKTVRPIDPSESPSGQVLLRAEFSSGITLLILEAKDIVRGEFTFEDELRTTLAAGRAKALKLRKLEEIISGSSTDLVALGQIDERVRLRIFLARLFEQDKNGGMPILADLSCKAPFSKDIEIISGGIRRFKNPSREPFPDFKLRSEVENYIKDYHKARYEVMKEILKFFQLENNSSDRPLYAALPVYIDSIKGKIEQKLLDYLKTYAGIVDYLRSNHSNLSWGEIFLLISLDSVVNWSVDEYKNTYLLIGPWHPLVVAKRYMVQASLYKSTKRFFASKGNWIFHRLAVLLEQINGFRWFFSIHNENETFEQSFTSATSDPGWMLAIKTWRIRDISNIKKILEDIHGTLGLESNLIPLGHDYMALNCMKSFFRSYPSKRALGIYVKRGYSPRRIVDSAMQLLFDDDGISEVGSQLPGGIHVYFEEDVETELDQIPWSEPPINIYCGDNGPVEAWDDFIDMALFPPIRSVTFARAHDNIYSPRGRDAEAIYNCPILKLSEGADGTPSTAIYELDKANPGSSSSDSVGEAFLDCLSKISSILTNPLCLSRVVGLPEKLKYPWTMFPGQQIDPAVFVKYIRDGYERKIQERALWDYRVSIEGSLSSFYILATIPPGFRKTLSGSPVLKGKDISAEVIKELGEIGIAIGTEAMKSGRKALGVLGVVGAIRLFITKPGEFFSPLLNDESNVGFLLPVDSFESFLEDPETRMKADLLAIQISLPNKETPMKISLCAIECKYVSGTFGDASVKRALEQANQTYHAVADIIRLGEDEDGILERLGLVNLLSFGLRLCARKDEEWISKEHEILTAILQRNFVLIEPLARSLLISTECGLDVAEMRKREGWWIRLASGHWPEISESEAIKKIRQDLSSIFLDLEETKPIEDVQKTESKPESLDAEALTSEQKHLESSLVSPILIGFDSNRKVISFDPQKAVQPLDNLNIMITGSSGKGKTALVKSILWDLGKQKRRVLIVDFKNDFSSDQPFMERSSLECQYVRFEGLRYNPLIPVPSKHPRSGQLVIQASEHISGLSSVFRQVYKLGPQQEFAVKDAIKESFQEYGISSGSEAFEYDEKQEYPDFNDVGQKLADRDPRARSRLDPLFDLGIFREEYKQYGFEQMLQGSFVVQLSDINSEFIKNAIAQILILSAQNYYNAQPHTTNIRQYIVFDEAYRLIASEYLPDLVRKSRAYGLGVILSSQYTSDFSPEVSGCMNTKIIHGNDRDESKVRSIVSLLGCHGKESKIANLGMFEAIISNAHYSNVFLYTMAYPQLLIYEHLKERKPSSVEAIRTIEGLSQDRIESLIEFMMKIGILEEVDGVYSLI